MIKVATPANGDAPKVRQQGIDAMRFIMALTVVLLHALPAQNEAGATDAMSYIAMMCRAAVPFFFIAGGYFLRPRQKDPIRIVLDPIKRLAPIFLFWMIVYFLISSVLPGHHWSWGMRDLISGGEAFHLWFLSALGFAMVVVSFGVKYINSWLLAAALLSLYMFSVVYNAYYDVILPPGGSTRGGFFAAPFFVGVGYFIGVSRVNLKISSALFVFISSLLLLFLEETIISVLSDKPIRSHDFALSTIPLGVSAFLLARSFQTTPIVLRLSALGGASLGIYVSHLLFIWLARPFTPVGVVGVVLLSFLAGCSALGLTLLLKRVPALKTVV